MFKKCNTLILGGLLAAAAVALAGSLSRRGRPSAAAGPQAGPHGLLQAQGQLRGKPGQAGRRVQALSLPAMRGRSPSRRVRSPAT